MSSVYGPMNKQARRTVAYFLKLIIEAGIVNSTMYAFGTMSGGILADAIDGSAQRH
jgi:hypothetical protein